MLSGLSFEFVFLKDLEIEDGDFVEDGETFEENAFKKAKYYAEKTGMIALGEDSGILVDALPGELGVMTRRWGAGEKANDQEWMDFFMARMEGEAQRGAHFICNACLYLDGEKYHFEGDTRGIIAKELQGPVKEGIPLSAVFMPLGMDRVYSALSEEEKAAVSHRGKSLNKVRDFLASLDADQ